MGNRDLFLRAAVVTGVAGIAITELLSAFSAIHRAPLLVCWTVVAVGLLFYARSKCVRIAIKTPDPVVALCVLVRLPPELTQTVKTLLAVR